MASAEQIEKIFLDGLGRDPTIVDIKNALRAITNLQSKLKTVWTTIELYHKDQNVGRLELEMKPSRNVGDLREYIRRGDTVKFYLNHKRDEEIDDSTPFSTYYDGTNSFVVIDAVYEDWE